MLLLLWFVSLYFSVNAIPVKVSTTNEPIFIGPSRLKTVETQSQKGPDLNILDIYAKIKAEFTETANTEPPETTSTVSFEDKDEGIFDSFLEQVVREQLRRLHESGELTSYTEEKFLKWLKSKG